MTEFRYMLDTNILSNIIRFPEGQAVRRLIDSGVNEVCVSAIVASEFRFGAAKRGSARLTRLVEELLQRVPVVPYAADSSTAYARIRRDLALAGTPIGPVDTFIAAHAMAEDVTLVTDNIREFARVPGLRVENWLAA